MRTTAACTRCGSLHTDAEAALGRRLSCSEVRRFWAEAAREHERRHTHRPRLVTDRDGRRVCHQCGRRVPG